MKVVFVAREVKDLDCNFVTLNNDKSIHYATSVFLNRELYPVGLILGEENDSSEIQCRAGYRKALKDAGKEERENYICHTTGTNESGFQAMAQLLQLDVPPKSVICTSTQLVEGALGALKWSGKSLSVIGMGESSWNDNRYPSVEFISRPSLLLGEKAANLLLENIKSPIFYDKKRIFINNNYADFEKNTVSQPNYKDTIKVMLPKGVCSKAAFDAMLPDLERKHGVRAVLEEYDFHPLYENIKHNADSAEYDVFIFDLSWLPEFASKGILFNLSDMIEKSDIDINGIVREDMQKYVTYAGEIYALLHRFTGQLLFYRKDLFEDVKIRRIVL